MGQEKERKFELLYVPTELLSELHKEEIEQGYLMFDGAKHLRIRIITLDNQMLRQIGMLGFKTVKSDEEKDEFEFRIPIEEAIELMASTKIKVNKTRYKTTFQGNSVDIDIFPNGISWVEIEFEKPFTELPKFCGREITGSKEFNNIAIAFKNANEKH